MEEKLLRFLHVGVRLEIIIVPNLKIGREWKGREGWRKGGLEGGKERGQYVYERCLIKIFFTCTTTISYYYYYYYYYY